MVASLCKNDLRHLHMNLWSSRHGKAHLPSCAYIAYSPSGAQTLEQKWSINSYEITFHLARSSQKAIFYMIFFSLALWFARHIRHSSPFLLPLPLPFFILLLSLPLSLSLLSRCTKIHCWFKLAANFLFSLFCLCVCVPCCLPAKNVASAHELETKMNLVSPAKTCKVRANKDKDYRRKI